MKVSYMADLEFELKPGPAGRCTNDHAMEPGEPGKIETLQLGWGGVGGGNLFKYLGGGVPLELCGHPLFI